MGRASRPLDHLLAGNQGRCPGQVVLPGSACRSDRGAEPRHCTGRRTQCLAALVRYPEGANAGQAQGQEHEGNGWRGAGSSGHRRRSSGHDSALLCYQGVDSEGADRPRGMNGGRGGGSAGEEIAGNTRAPGGIIFDDGLWFVSHHTGPYTDPGELILKTRRHCESLAELTEPEATALGRILTDAIGSLEQVLAAERIYAVSFN